MAIPGLDNILGGLSGLLSGIFTHPERAYQKETDTLRDYLGRAIGTQQPYEQAGQNALGDYQRWLSGMQNPGDFVNRQMSQYQESPYARYMQNQATRGGINAASASGLIGSTPYMQQAEQTAHDISSGDLENYLNHVFGVNQLYGQGVGDVMHQGFNAAGNEANLYSGMGTNIAQGEFGAESARQNRISNIIGGLLGGLSGGMNMYNSFSNRPQVQQGQGYP